MKATISSADGPKPRRTMLPLLLVLFVISYGMLTTLVVLQDRTIDSQRGLIHLLFQDSVRLSALGMHKPPTVLQGQQTTPQQNAANQRSANSKTQSSVQAETSQDPQSQAKQQANGKPGRNSKKAEKPLPTRPPAELTDPSDMRRVTFSI